MGNLLSGVTLNIAEGTSDNLIFSMLSKICPILTMGFGKRFDLYFESQTNFKFTFHIVEIKGRFKLNYNCASLFLICIYWLLTMIPNIYSEKLAFPYFIRLCDTLKSSSKLVNFLQCTRL